MDSAPIELPYDELRELQANWRLSEEQFTLLMGSEIYASIRAEKDGKQAPALSPSTQDRLQGFIRLKDMTAIIFPNDLGASWIHIFGNQGINNQTPLVAMTTRRSGVEETLRALSKIEILPAVV